MAREISRMRVVQLFALIVVVTTGAVVHEESASARVSHVRFGHPRVVMSCPASGCYEPSVAVDRKGRVFVTEWSGDVIGVSTNGGSASFSRVPAPPRSTPRVDRDGANATVQVDPRDRLVYSRAIAGLGIQVAVSSTGARTWDSNTIIASQVLAIRPWLGFAPNGTVYALWHTWTGPPYPCCGFSEGNHGSYWLASSPDGGRMFGAPQPFLPGSDIFSTGPPIVDASGRAYVPVILGFQTREWGMPEPWPAPGSQTIALAVSPHPTGPASFALHHVAEETAADFFPIAALDSSGRIEVAWRGTDSGVHSVLVSESADRGQTWSQPQLWSEGSEATASPWISLRRGRVDVLWYAVRQRDRESSLMLSRGGADGWIREQSVVDASVMGQPGGLAANTDYANLALLPDGRVIAVFIDWAVRVSVEAKAR
jgi:hypothetical protein